MCVNVFEIIIQVAIAGVTILAVVLAFRFNIESMRYEKMSENWLKIMVSFMDYLKSIGEVSSNQININLDTQETESSLDRFKRKIGESSQKINELASRLYFYLPNATYDHIDALILELNACREIIYRASGNLIEGNELNEAQEKALKAFYALKEHSDKILKIRSGAILSKRRPDQRHSLEL